MESAQVAAWIADGVKEADRNRPRDVTLRDATVQSFDSGLQAASVIVDGDEFPSDVQVRSSGVSPGARVLVAFTRDGGAYVVGSSAAPSGGWVPYLPVLRFGATEWTQGDGEIRGLFRDDGDETEFIVTVGWGATSGIPAGGALSVTLPAQAINPPGHGLTIGTNTGYPTVSGMILDAGTARGWFPGWISPDFLDRAFLLRAGIGVMGTVEVDDTVLAPGSPGFAVGDQIHIRGRYARL